MAQYFTFEQLKVALDDLRMVDGKWLLIPLVLAANGVGSAAPPTAIVKSIGTDAFLERFFNAEIIGLEPRTPGRTANIRPLFQGLTPERPDDLAKKSEGKLWANGFSQSGYNDWRNNGTLEKTALSQFQLGPNFSNIFREAVPATFKFEHLLVWLYAFSGIEDNISSWDELLQSFLQNHTANNAFPPEYQGVFTLAHTEPWPTNFLTDRPSNTEFQDFLLPGVSASHILPSELRDLCTSLTEKLKAEYLGFSGPELESLAVSVVSDLQSCKRLFILGEPGAGKSELARLIVAAFKDVFDDRVLAISTPITDSTTTDKLIGFSTLDGTWIDGILTAPDNENERQLLYARTPGNPPTLSPRAKRQINVLVLDEANRKDVEGLLGKIQGGLDGVSGIPDSDEYRAILDNSGERFLSPNTFVVMTGNSPREDAGRLVQARPFKRRHNLIVMPNVFSRVLGANITHFVAQLSSLWAHVGPSFQLTETHRNDFTTAMAAPTNQARMEALKIILSALHEYSIGVTYGLVKKVLLTAGARYGLTENFSTSIDIGLTESISPLLATEVVVGGQSLRERLDQTDEPTRASFPAFFSLVTETLQPVDNFNRVRPFM